MIIRILHLRNRFQTSSSYPADVIGRGNRPISIGRLQTKTARFALPRIITTVVPRTDPEQPDSAGSASVGTPTLAQHRDSFQSTRFWPYRGCAVYSSDLSAIMNIYGSSIFRGSLRKCLHGSRRLLMEMLTAEGRVGYSPRNHLKALLSEAGKIVALQGLRRGFRWPHAILGVHFDGITSRSVPSSFCIEPSFIKSLINICTRSVSFFSLQCLHCVSEMDADYCHSFRYLPP